MEKNITSGEKLEPDTSVDGAEKIYNCTHSVRDNRVKGPIWSACGWTGSLDELKRTSCDELNKVYLHCPRCMGILAK